MCFDLKRRSHRAIRSFRSITVLRKWSERRVLRRGSLWRFLFPVSFPPKETGSRRSVKSPRPNSRLSSPLRRAIVRVSADSPLASAFRSAVPSPPAGTFLCSPKERYQRNALKGTCAGAVPLRIPPRLPRGLRPPLDPPGAYGGRETLDGSRIKV